MQKAPRPYHLTPSEEIIMTVLWASKEPLSQQQIIDEVARQKLQIFKDRSIFTLLNNLKDKKLIAEVGFVRSGKTYARTFASTSSRANYYAHMVYDILGDKELVEFRKTLKNLSKTAAEEE